MVARTVAESPAEIKTRESLFSSASSAQAWNDNPNYNGGSDDSGRGGGSDNRDETLQEYPSRQSPRDRQDNTHQEQRRQGAGESGATRRTTATSAAYMPASALSAGWVAGRGRPWRSPFARKPRSLRRAIVAAPWTSPVVAHHLAAVHVRDRRNAYVSCNINVLVRIGHHFVEKRQHN